MQKDKGFPLKKSDFFGGGGDVRGREGAGGCKKVTFLSCEIHLWDCTDKTVLNKRQTSEKKLQQFKGYFYVLEIPSHSIYGQCADSGLHGKPWKHRKL